MAHLMPGKVLLLMDTLSINLFRIQKAIKMGSKMMKMMDFVAPVGPENGLPG